MKYSDPIIWDENEAHSMILKKIQSGSKVLEFGAAGGRMTKLLQQNYGCSVWIVEVEQEAFAQAVQYADHGICADIEDFQWEKWAGVDFDYILFCDVLEHLRDPKKVLAATKKLLKAEGSVLVSLPNIGHNDIWMKLFYNRFEYTEIGLLDDTHIHFFAEKTLDNFIKGTGYRIISKQFKTVPTGMTEQYWKEPFCCIREAEQMLRRRENGEVYQFVLELKKESPGQNMCQPCCEVQYQPLRGWVYFDRGNGFSQEDVDEIAGNRIQEDEYEFRGKLRLGETVQKIRIDPVERQMCRIVSVECSLGEPFVPDEVMVQGQRIIMDEDPQLIWNIPKEIRNTEVEFNLKIRVDMAEIWKGVKQYRHFLEEGQETLRRRNIEYEECILKLEQRNKENEGYISELEQKNVDYLDEIQQIKCMLDEIYHSKSWKYTKFLRKIHACVMQRH